MDDIREHLRTQNIKRSDSAIRTILRIMVEKGLVKGEVQGRTTIYQAAIQRETLEKNLFKHIINVLFEGKQDDFMLRVLDEASGSQKVIDKMKTIAKSAKSKK